MRQPNEVFDGLSPLQADAVRYAVERREALTHLCDDARLEADNNRAENCLRPIALGRKNYLFAGSDKGGERAAAIYTILQTAKLNHIDPEAWLLDVLTRIADGHPSIASAILRRGVGAPVLSHIESPNVR